MNEFLNLACAGTVGLLLGAVFFGGLWWTVRRGMSSPYAALWFMGSLLLRTSIVLLGFYFAGRGDWRRLVSCLLGFGIARFAVMRVAYPPIKPRSLTRKETNDAP